MKYLHFLVDQFYSKEFIELVNSHFNAEEHLFIVIKEENKKKHIESENFRNIKIFNFKGNFLTKFLTIKYKTIRKLMKQADNIFIHYLTEEVSGILFGFRGKAKIIWIMWGADLYKYIPIQLYDQFTLELISKLDNKFQSILKRILFLFQFEIRKAVIKRLDYVISQHKGDIRLFKKYFKTDAKCSSQAIYTNPVEFERFDIEGSYSINEKFNFKKEGGKLLLLGNSGFPTNNHLDILIRLSKMKEQNFKIICPLSYGPPIYIKKIIEKGKMFFGDRFIPLLDFLSPDKYFGILKQIDLAIMYHNRQQSMGTIHIIVYLEKPICMKKTSGYFHLIENNTYIFSVNHLEKLILCEIGLTRAMSEHNKKMALNKIYSKKSTISSIEKLLYLLDKDK